MCWKEEVEILEILEHFIGGFVFFWEGKKMMWKSSCEMLGFRSALSFWLWLVLQLVSDQMLRPVGSHVSCNNNPGSIFPRVLFDRFLKNGSVFPQRHYIYTIIYILYIYMWYTCVYTLYMYIYIYLHTLPQESISRLPYFCVFCNNIVAHLSSYPSMAEGWLAYLFSWDVWSNPLRPRGGACLLPETWQWRFESTGSENTSRW